MPGLKLSGIYWAQGFFEPLSINHQLRAIEVKPDASARKSPKGINY
jgi:hypothetical protein